ncbi:MAG: hypothetical protein HC779_01575 [Phyllobacteriaceae bacterium]|nr:hypothetical protein [Phyllobacteriaceae bacterium]
MLRRNLYVLVTLCIAVTIFVLTKPETPTGRNEAGRPAPQARQASLPGFDFYVLSLSWSPTWCAEQGTAADGEAQCSGSRDYGFVVHGLWPQRERGWPEFCETAFGKRIDGAIADDMLDIMPIARSGVSSVGVKSWLVLRAWPRTPILTWCAPRMKRLPCRSGCGRSTPICRWPLQTLSKPSSRPPRASKQCNCRNLLAAIRAGSAHLYDREPYLPAMHRS